MAITFNELQIFKLTEAGLLNKPILSTSFNDLPGKCRAIHAVVNLARLANTYRERNLFISSDIPFNTKIQRPFKAITITISSVEVEYTNVDKFNYMLQFYKVMRDNNVPNLEFVDSYNESKQVLYLKPVGIRYVPKNVVELKEALNHLYSCITGMHTSGYVHCDIRWANIICYFDRWYLIDCTEAVLLSNNEGLLAASKQYALTQFVFDDNKPWSVRFDWYQVGCLLNERNFDFPLDNNLIQLRDHLKLKNCNEVNFELIENCLSQSAE